MAEDMVTKEVTKQLEDMDGRLAQSELNNLKLQTQMTLEKQIPNAPEDLIISLTELLSTQGDEKARGDSMKALMKLKDLGAEKPKSETLKVDAAGSTSKEGDTGADGPNMGTGPSSWGSLVDQAFQA